MAKKPTLDDIAAKLGVSKSLVSFVLSGQGKRHRISERLCEKVRQTAMEMNYQPNYLAKSLRTGKTQTIGLIIADMANPFFGRLAREIESEAERFHYKVMVCSSDENNRKSARQINDLLNYHVDGLIICPPAGSREQIEGLINNNFPLVLLDRDFPGLNAHYVGVDNYNGAYQGTMHLLKLGYKRIANLTMDTEMPNMKERVDGFRQAMKDEGFAQVDDCIQLLPFTHESEDIASALNEICTAEEKMEAVFLSNGKLGIMAIEYLLSLGKRFPEDIAIVSFDNPDAYRICAKPITCIDQPLTEMGTTAVRLLVDEIAAGGGSAEKQKIILKTRFIVRQSCGAQKQDTSTVSSGLFPGTDC